MRITRSGPPTWFVAHIPGAHFGGSVVPLTATRVPAMLDQGSLMMEISLGRAETTALSLFNLTQGRDVLDLSFDPTQGLHLRHRQGRAEHNVILPLEQGMMDGGRWLISWRWSRADRSSILTLEALETGTFYQRITRGPLPLSQADVVELATGRGRATISAPVQWLAAGAHLHPHGPGACFAPATPIMTPDGLRPAGRLRPGDLVETIDAGPQPVLWSGRLSLPTFGCFNPVRLCAPYFGADSDLWVLPQHRIALSGPAVDYILGEEEVLLPAHHLVDTCTARQTLRSTVLEWQGILLEDHHLLIADGFPVESLAVQGLTAQPSFARTTALADLSLAGWMPDHQHLARRALAPFEAQTLALARMQNRTGLAAA
ncbi:hypothetical protein BFP70_15175 [Thioclava sp. SK-1]|uniref:Hint domain-containing protein n=1 Tax=Thioclava sp. SK-1 TaxID=1889770 RepID=UPI0008259680|nr:Hint domain-containing protein [Thioclava sp. SK-1]OCX61648.1 hypothetical protein BFP70_15175 [Thioclava sp. SK-1]